VNIPKGKRAAYLAQIDRQIERFAERSRTVCTLRTIRYTPSWMYVHLPSWETYDIPDPNPLTLESRLGAFPLLGRRGQIADSATASTATGLTDYAP